MSCHNASKKPNRKTFVHPRSHIDGNPPLGGFPDPGRGSRREGAPKGSDPLKGSVPWQTVGDPRGLVLGKDRPLPLLCLPCLTSVWSDILKPPKGVFEHYGLTHVPLMFNPHYISSGCQQVLQHTFRNCYQLVVHGIQGVATAVCIVTLCRWSYGFTIEKEGETRQPVQSKLINPRVPTTGRAACQHICKPQSNNTCVTIV